MNITLASLVPLALLCAAARGQLDARPDSSRRAASAPDALALDPAQPYTAELRAPVGYEVDFAAVIMAPHGTKVLRVWMPVPPSDAAQRIERSRFETFPVQVEPEIAAEPMFGNRFACFEFREPKGAQMIRHRFHADVHELRWHVEPGKVVSVARWPESFAPYLHGDQQAVVVDDQVRSIAASLQGPAGSGPMHDVLGALEWVDAHMSYDHGRSSLAASSRWALEHGVGHCSDYHSLCSALGRALHHPTRVTYGMNLFAKDSPSHCKMEAFLPPYGWVSFDVSETQKQCAGIRADAAVDEARKQALVAAAHGRLRQGFRDNTWLLVTRGTDYDLVPKASRKVPVVRTIWAEADGVPLPEPDPADPKKREFAWMTLHSFTPDHAVTYPFADRAQLEAEVK